MNDPETGYTYESAGVSIAAGRAVPAGVQIVPSPESLVMRIPADIEGLGAVDDGTLRPL